MNLTHFALKRNRVTYMALLVVIAFGLLSYQGLPRDSMPPFTLRIATIVTNFSGASPERMEALISDPIEKVAQEIPEAKYISSTSRTGLSVVSVSLNDDVPAKDLQAIWDRIRRKVEALKPSLPEGIQGPDVKDDDIGVVYGIFVGLTADGFSYREQETYAETLRDQLIALDDASKVEIGGIIEERVFIEYDDAELASIGLSSNQLRSAISATNIIIPAGEVGLEDERIVMEASGNLESIDELKNLLINVGNTGNTIPLGEITRIYRDYITPRKAIVKINGEEALALYVSLKEGANIIKLGEEVDRLVAEVNQTLPVGMEAIRIASQDYEVEKSINDFVSNVLQSVVIVLLVVLAFLGLRAGLVVASIIPAAIIATLLLMSVFEVGLNQVSLAALIMALGLLVDNGIVMVESLLERMEEGETAFEAAVNSCKEFLVPLLISSLTTSAAFLAFYLAQSVLGEIMGNLFLVITMALLSSWVMAFTVIPLLGVALLKVKKGQQHGEEKSFIDGLVAPYNRWLSITLKRPYLILGGIFGLFVLALIGFTRIPFVFMPDSDRALVTLEMNLPLGTKIEQTQAQVRMIEDFISDSLWTQQGKEKGVVDWSSYIGEGPNSFDQGYNAGEANSAYAYMIVNTSDFQDNRWVMDQLDRYCAEHLPDAQVSVKMLVSGGGASVPIQVRLSGSEPDELYRISEAVKTKLYSIRGAKNIDDNWGPKMKKFFIQIDPVKLSFSGLTNQDIAQSLTTVLSGQSIGEYRERENTIPIVMKGNENINLTYQDVESMNVYAQGSGRNVPLSQVATIIPEWQYAKILRRDLRRTLTVEADLAEGVTASDVTDELVPWLEEQQQTVWKPGYQFELGGESESSGDAMGAVIAQLPISIFIMTLLLVIQFNSFRKTAIILSTIPLGLVGVVGGLLVTGSVFSFTGFLGIIALAGIIINDGIVLLDKINSEIELFGKTPYQAIVKAANNRLKPILLTTFTTSFGMIPLWIGGGDMWRPMAIAIIFGLFFATIILLFFVPALFKVLFRVKEE
ncbi:MAG: efflux RND transporter permease subunit [Bacteroidota bacterium]